MSLDLGALVGRVILLTEGFDRPYARVVRQFAQLGADAEKAAAGTATLDRGLTGVGTASADAAAGLTAAQRAVAPLAATEDKAAVAATRHATALARVAEVMGPLEGATSREQQAALRLAAAQERLTALQESGTATTRQLASAQAGLIGATDRVAAAQQAAAASATRQGEATAAAAASTRIGSSAMAGFMKTAAGLGLAIGVFEAIKKAIDIGKEAAVFQHEMLLIQTQAGASAAEVKKMTAAVLSLAGSVATAPDKLAVSLYHVESIGLRGAKALDLVRIAAEGAKVGNADLEQTTNALTATVASGIPGVRNYSQAMGALNAIVGAGDMKLTDLNSALSSGLMVTMKNYGLSLVDVGGALATFGDHNVRGANAATQLRMAVMALAVPARGGEKVLAELGLTSEGSAKELAKLGLKTGDLAKDLQTGGLNKAILDLNGHLKSANISTAQTGTVLTQVFGKRAGIGLQILIGDLPRFEQKLKQVAAGAGGFGAAWQATTHTASFAFQKLSVEAQVAGLTVANKLIPSITSAAQWMGTALPNALRTVSETLTPLGHIVGGVLTHAWTVLSDAVRVAASGFSAIGSVLKGHAQLFTDISVAVLGMWAAFKGIAIAQAAIKAIDLALGRLAARAPAAGQAIASSMTVANGAMLGLGVAVAVAAHIWQQHQADVAANKAAIDAYTQAIESDSGALGKNTRALVENNLETAGSYQTALKLGISQRTLTDAVLGYPDAIAAVTAAQKGSNAANQAGFFGNIALLGSVKGNTAQIRAAIVAARDKAAADGNMGNAMGQVKTATAGATAAIDKNATVLQYTVDAAGRLVPTMVSAANAADSTTSAMDRQTTASKLLKQSLDILNGVNVSLEQDNNALQDSFNTFTAAVQAAKKAGDGHAASLDRNTVSGLKNRENLVALIEAAKTQAQATADSVAATSNQTAGLIAGNKQLAENEARIRAVAASMGLNKKQTDALIRSLGQLSTIKPVTTPKVATDPAKQKIVDLQARIDRIKQGKEPNLNANSVEGRGVITALQQQINALRGRTVTIGANTSTAQYKLGNLLSTIRTIGQGATADVYITTRNKVTNEVHTVVARAGGGTIPGFAAGGTPGQSGTVFGPGGPKSDSILTRLSAGEEVIQNPYAAQYRTLLKSINSGRGVGALATVGARSATTPQHAAAAPAPALSVYVQNPFTGEYLLAQVADVADERMAGAFDGFSQHATYN